ncbi:MAG: ATP-binding protein [Polyangiales bacterium]
MAAEHPDIHRASEVTRVTSILEERNRGLSIVAISGAGGVGKTFLVNHILECMPLEGSGYMLLRADASNAQARGDFFALVEGQLFRRSLPPPADSRKDYFPKLRDVANIYASLVEEASAEMEGKEVPADIRRVAVTMLNAGRFLNKMVPITGQYLDLARIRDTDVDKAVQAANSALHGLKTFRETSRWPGPLRDVFGVTRRARVGRDLFALTAEEIRADLSAALVGYERKDAARLSHPSIPGLDRVLIVLDDYEAIQPVLSDFLVGALVPQLAAAPFQTVLLVVGRDDLEITHPGWSQHSHRFLRDQIRLAPFDEATARDVFSQAGIPRTRWDALFEATQGYPFLLSLVIEEEADYQSGSVVFLRRFYDRTTRWMTEEERDWFVRLCYLDKVNEDTLGMLFEPEDVQRIQDWFEKEPSIRDPAAPYFRVRPLIRDKMLRYQEVRAPSRHRELLALARSVEPDRPRPSLVSVS